MFPDLFRELVTFVAYTVDAPRPSPASKGQGLVPLSLVTFGEAVVRLVVRLYRSVASVPEVIEAGVADMIIKVSNNFSGS